MRWIACVLALAVAAVCVSAHICEHEQRQREAVVTTDTTEPPPSLNDARFHATQTRVPIRFATSTTRLNNGADSQTDYNVLTTAKANYIKNVLLPGATAWLSSALSVTPFTGSFAMTSCYQISGVTAAETTQPNKDFLILVTARATDPGVLAWAAYCKTGSDGRPIAAQINFGPGSIVENDPSQDAYQLSVAIHEISHALGFSSNAYDSYRNADGSLRKDVYAKVTTPTGVTKNVITLPRVVQRVRDHYGCPTAAYMELEEFGGSGTAGSHWEAREVDNEYMAGRASQRAAYSLITLALFEDSGWYTPDYTKATAFTYGKNRGCSMLNSRCNTWSTDYYCDTQQAEGCTYDGAKAQCSLTTYSAALPSTFQYFTNTALGGRDQMMDYCPLWDAYSNGYCDVVANQDSDTPLRGETFSSTLTSRCMMGNILKTGYSDSGKMYPLCIKYECRGTAAAPELWVSPVINNANDFKKCSNGASLTGFANVIAGRVLKCPTDITTFCPVGAGATATATPTATATATASVTATPRVTTTPGANASVTATPAATTPPAVTATATATANPGSSCPNACSSRGICGNGVCTCEEGYTGSDCSVDETNSNAVLLTMGGTSSGTLSPGQYDYYRVPVSLVFEKLIVTVSGSGNPDIVASFGSTFPSKSHRTFGSMTLSSPTSLTISYSDPAYKTADLIVGVYAESGQPSSYTITANKQPVTTNTTIPCPFDCSGVGRCVANSTFSECKDCPARRRGRGCQIDDAKTYDFNPSNMMLSSTGATVTRPTTPGQYDFVYIPIRSPADFEITLRSTDANHRMFGAAARDGHPVDSSHTYDSSPIASTTDRTFQVIQGDPSYPTTGFYVGTITNLAGVTYELNVKMSNVKDKALLKLCDNDCGSSGATCEEGVCVSSQTGSDTAPTNGNGKNSKRSTLYAAIAAPAAVLVVVGAIIAGVLSKRRRAAAQTDQSRLRI